MSKASKNTFEGWVVKGDALDGEMVKSALLPNGGVTAHVKTKAVRGMFPWTVEGLVYNINPYATRGQKKTIRLALVAADKALAEGVGVLSDEGLTWLETYFSGSRQGAAEEVRPTA